MKKVFLYSITAYQRLVSPYLPQSCRFQPTCSEYTKEAIELYGVIKGIFFGAKRVTKCHPFKILGGSEGYDPVPKNK